MALFIGIDSGTQSTKAVVLDLDAMRHHTNRDANARFTVVNGVVDQIAERLP